MPLPDNAESSPVSQEVPSTPVVSEPKEEYDEFVYRELRRKQ